MVDVTFPDGMKLGFSGRRKSVQYSANHGCNERIIYPHVRCLFPSISSYALTESSSTTGSGRSFEPNYIPLGLSCTSLANLITVCGFPKHLTSIIALRTSHLFRCTHHDPKTKDPVAICEFICNLVTQDNALTSR